MTTSVSSSPTTVQRVLVLGYARAGSSILLALGRRPAQFHTSLLVRPATLAGKADQLAPFRALGIELVEGDVNAEEAALTALVSGYHIVISCITHQRFGTDELRLVRACLAAGVSRYLPTAFGIDEQAVGRGSAMAVVLDKKLDNYAALTSSGLATIVSCGFWTEWLLGAGFGNLLGLDWQQRAITAVGSFDCKVSTTSLLDLGELVAEVLLDPATLHAHVHVQSDLVTLEQVAAALERATGQSWQRKVLSIAEAEALQAATPGSWTYTGRLMIAHQRGLWWPVADSWNSADRQLPFKLHKLEEVVEQVAKQKKLEQAQQASS